MDERGSGDLFAEESIIRQVNQESILLLGGSRALLMQIADPRVAACVAEHSTFHRDRLGRLTRTLRPMYAIVFGSASQAHEAAAAVRRRHRAVVGEGYDASDPELLLWVHATLVDTALEIYTRFVRPLSAEAEAVYYRDATRMGELLGIPREVVPADIDEFRDYLARTTAAIEVSDTARWIRAQILAPRPFPAAPIVLGLRQPTAGLLPPPIRAQYELAWGPGRERLLTGVSAVSRASWRHLPQRLRRPSPFMPPRVSG